MIFEQTEESLFGTSNVRFKRHGGVNKPLYFGQTCLKGMAKSTSCTGFIDGKYGDVDLKSSIDCSQTIAYD